MLLDFSHLGNLDNFEEYWSDILYYVCYLGFIWCGFDVYAEMMRNFKREIM